MTAGDEADHLIDPPPRSAETKRDTWDIAMIIQSYADASGARQHLG
ncbi:hypothetical protein SAMN06265370_10375 [Puniceibacterium sediminis]|uniref:Uncharacterized protein n=1 Tax=Puniceibacterium sediminis TaxID=1608407 RepID=A0A238VS79_9RHOB|nr:hypothetical protein SAMN06265370_10375 [Puniceibacterium sediminis]